MDRLPAPGPAGRDDGREGIQGVNPGLALITAAQCPGGENEIDQRSGPAVEIALEMPAQAASDREIIENRKPCLIKHPRSHSSPESSFAQPGPLC